MNNIESVVSVIVRQALLIFCVSLTGCAVVQDAQHEFRKEMVGFKSNWDQYILKKDVPYNYE